VSFSDEGEEGGRKGEVRFEWEKVMKRRRGREKEGRKEGKRKGGKGGREGGREGGRARRTKMEEEIFPVADGACLSLIC